MRTLSLLVVIFGIPLNAKAETFKITPDFFVMETRNSLAGGPDLPALDCRANIRKVICLVDPLPDSAKEEEANQRPCLPGSEAYAAPLEEVHDAFPAHLQKMFCYLSRINVEKDTLGSAYAGILKNSQQEVLGGILGIRESLLHGNISLEQWASWKEQTHFGADPKKIQPLAGLPMVRSNVGSSSLGMLYFLVSHEFGHIFDFANALNQYQSCPSNSDRCPVKPGSWGALSFEQHTLPRLENDFALRPLLCFYFCNGNWVSAIRQDELFRDLGRTNFLTAYTTRYPEEDFADTFALYTMSQELKVSYVIETASGLRSDVMARLYSPPLDSKRRAIEKFLASPYRYPEPSHKKTNPL